MAFSRMSLNGDLELGRRAPPSPSRISVTRVEVELRREVEGRDRADRLAEPARDRLADLRERLVAEVALARDDRRAGAADAAARGAAAPAAAAASTSRLMMRPFGTGALHAAAGRAHARWPGDAPAGRSGRRPRRERDRRSARAAQPVRGSRRRGWDVGHLLLRRRAGFALGLVGAARDGGDAGGLLLVRDDLLGGGSAGGRRGRARARDERVDVLVRRRDHTGERADRGGRRPRRSGACAARRRRARRAP